MAKRKVEIPDDIKSALKQIVDDFEREDQSVRERQVRIWKKLQFMWAGFTRIWWSDTAHDWRIFDQSTEEMGDNQDYYDKNINVFRAYLESIIAAMSATVPGIRCKPDDADNVNDVTTAKGGTKIAQLIYDHNDAPLLWMKALFVYCTQGMVAAYNHSVEDEKYGLIARDNYQDFEEDDKVPYCPNCKQQLDEPTLEAAIQSELNEADEFNPGDDDSQLHFAIGEGQVLCPACQQMIDPEMRDEKVTVTRLVGITQQPKSRQEIVIEGGLYVRVANYVRKQCDAPYVAYCYETHYSNVYAKYPHLREVMNDLGTGISNNGNELYDRWGRLSPQYYGEQPLNTPTVRNWWLRSSAFECINDEEVRKKLYKRFPDGCKVVFVNDTLAEACNENLDDHWTLTYNPLAEYIHFDPLGLMITSIQEITSDLISLILQTIEHGIGQTFADPRVLNFNQYRQTEVLPGDIFPVTPKSGKNIGDSFFELKTATLSQEVVPVAEKVQELGEFLSGAMPSVFGGDQNNSSRTASQYAMSRAQALQRLQNPWKMLTFWWQNIFGKVIPAYISNMLEDERIVQKQGDNYINIVIKKAEMEGKIGAVELEAADDIPMTTAQVKDVIMNLLQINNPEILATLAIPSNLPIIAKAIGLVDLVVPGEDDREKQLEEIQILIKSGPTEAPNPQTGQMEETATVQPEMMVDNHDVEASICRQWLVSEAGRQCKVDNEPGYRNVLMHLKAHMMAIQQLKMMMNGGNIPQQPNANPGAQGQKPQLVKGASANPPKQAQPPIQGEATNEEMNHAS